MTESRNCSECGSALNRYSPGERCGSCAWEARARVGEAPVLPEGFWAEPAMRNALTRRDLRAVLRIYMDATLLTQEAVALLIGSHQGSVSKILSGKRNRYTIENVESFRDGLHIPGELLGLQPSRHERAVEIKRPPIGETDTSVIPGVNVDISASPHPKDDDVKRRELLQDTAVLTAGATITPVLATLAGAWQASEPVLPGASVSQAMIDDWEDAAIVHAQRARVVPPAVVLAALAADFTAMAPHLGRAQPDAVRRDLAHAAAPHAMLIAGKFVDLGNRRESRRWWYKTRSLADQSGDPLLASWLRSREAIYRRGDSSEDLDDVLSVAREARRLAGKKPSAPLVAALTAEAQILASMGRVHEAVSALKLAETTFNEVSVPPVVDPHWAQREEGLWFDKSLIYTLAHDVRQATEAQDTLLGRDTEYHTTVVIRLHRAALEARSDPTSGLEEASRVVAAIPHERRRTNYLWAAGLTLSVIPDKAAALPAARELRALVHR